MHSPTLEAAHSTHLGTDRTISFWDPDAECELVVGQPSVERDLWVEYVAGARLSYRKHGVESALDTAEIFDCDNTALFFAAIDRAGRVIGGVRAKGPYRNAEDSHAVEEWRGQPGQDAVRKMIDDRVPFGVVEMKTAWVADDPNRNRGLTTTLARSAYPAMALLDCQFLMATAATHVLDSWRSSGGIVASKIPATPYPDARYRTKIMWWDRRTFVNHAEPRQAAKIVAEMKQLTHIINGYAQSESGS
jgi:hypothetical protein